MINIREEWKTWRCGPCSVTVDVHGWLQRQDQSNRIKLEVTLGQHQCLGLFPSLKQDTLEAVIDTGAYCSIISRTLFEKCGFLVPHVPASNLHVSGVVRRSKTIIEDCESLWGWAEVPMRAHLLDRLYGCTDYIPSCKISLMVAENVSDDKFLLGLDFLRQVPVMLKDNVFIVLGG